MTRTILGLATPAVFAFAALSLVACNGSKSSEDDSADAGSDGGEGGDGGADGGTDGGDGGTAADCPDDVPEEYRYIWDCDLSSCPGGPLIYRYATGESVDEPPYTTIRIEESYYVFSSGGYCIDTFLIEGGWTNTDPTTYRCSECEETFHVTWTMSTGNACGMVWGSLFFGREGADELEGPWDGALALDTHGDLSGRTDRALVVAAPWLRPSDGATYQDPNWGYAYTTPTTDFDGPPETYVYSNTDYGGICANGGRMVKDPGGDWVVNDSFFADWEERRAQAEGVTPLLAR